MHANDPYSASGIFPHIVYVHKHTHVRAHTHTQHSLARTHPDVDAAVPVAVAVDEGALLEHAGARHLGHEAAVSSGRRLAQLEQLRRVLPRRALVYRPHPLQGNQKLLKFVSR